MSLGRCHHRAQNVLKRPAEARQVFEGTFRKTCDFPAVLSMFASADYIEGPRGFAEKRKPVWTSHVD